MPPLGGTGKDQLNGSPKNVAQPNARTHLCISSDMPNRERTSNGTVSAQPHSLVSRYWLWTTWQWLTNQSQIKILSGNKPGNGRRNTRKIAIEIGNVEFRRLRHAPIYSARGLRRNRATKTNTHQSTPWPWAVSVLRSVNDTKPMIFRHDGGD